MDGFFTIRTATDTLLWNLLDMTCPAIEYELINKNECAKYETEEGITELGGFAGYVGT